MDLGIKGKRALVLGASQGLGAGIAAALAEEGCDVAMVARSEDKLGALAESLQDKHGVKTSAHAIDLTDKDMVDVFCQEVRSEIKPDILINNAGGPPPGASLGLSDEDWEAAVQGLLLSLVRLTEAAVEVMQERGWGRVLTIGSSGIVQPIPNLALSNTVRLGMVGFCKTLAGEVGKDGITVNMILPGRIDTERVETLDANAAKRQNISVEEVRDRSKAQIPLGRYGTVEEFARVAAFLVSGPASYVNGHMMRVDGGYIKSV